MKKQKKNLELSLHIRYTLWLNRPLVKALSVLIKNLLAQLLLIFFYLIGRFHEAASNYKTALRYYQKAIAIKPTFAKGCYKCGVVKYKQKEFADAINYYTKAISAKPLYADAYIHRGTTKYEILDFENALLDFSKAIEIRESSMAYSGRAFAYLALKNEAAAKEDFARMKKLWSDENVSSA